MSDLDPRRLPFIGNSIYRAGQVREIIMQPCTPDPTIMVKAFFANTPLLIWSLVKPSPIDYVTERFGRGHKNRRKGKWTPLNVDPALPGGGTGLRWAAWRGLHLLERIGWYFLVADATSEFALNWTSMAYRFSGCQDPLTGYAHAQRTSSFEWFHTGAPFQMGGASFSFSPTYGASNSSVAKFLPGPRSVTSGISISTAVDNPKGTISKVEVREINGPSTKRFELDLTDPINGGLRTGGRADISYDLTELPATWQMWVETTPGYVRVDGWNLQVSGLNIDPGYGPDP